MRSEADILAHVVEWANANETVRAAVLTSSRAHPGAPVDDLSDYDIELYVTDLGDFREGDAWLEPFGSILVRWPAEPRSTLDDRGITRLVLFRDGVRLDFQITDRTEIAPNAYRNGYRVLIDKDGMMNTLVRPTFDAFVVRLPDRTTFETRAREFWWDATYVPKYLLRDELPFAKYMLDHVLRHEFLQPMVEWFIAVHHVGPVETGVCGRWFKRYLDPQTWGELESTYAGAGRKENAESYRRMVRLYRRLARDVAGRFGYDYPEALDRDVTEYCEGILHRLPIGAEHGAS